MTLSRDNSKKLATANKKNTKQEITCEHCGLYGFLDLLDELKLQTGALPSDILTRRQPLTKGESLFRKGQPFYAIFAIQSGSFKSFTRPVGGDEQVLGFHFPGELVGIESMLSPEYSSTIQALEPSAVCQLEIKNTDMPDDFTIKLQQLTIKILTQQVNQERRQSLLSARQTADERMAAFLFNVWERLSERNLCNDEL
jgi:CRP/FNR family transcriptional regulator, anaerobic regulatory protein